MSKGFNYFRIKMAYKGTNDQGAIVTIKSEDLVMATCYTCLLYTSPSPRD